MASKQDSGSSKLNDLLISMNEEGDFPISVITDHHGLVIAFASKKGLDPERQSAMVAFIQKAASQVGKQLGMAQTDEVSLFDKNGQRLVCRPFNIGDIDMILAVIVPDKSLSYRRITNGAISQIKRTWKVFRDQ